MNEEPHSELSSSSVLKSARWNSIGQSIAQGIRFLSFIVLAGILAPDEFGLMSMALVVVGLLSLFQNMGTTSAIIQTSELTPNLLDSVYWLNVFVCFALAALLWVSAGLTATVFADARLGPVLEFVALGFLAVGFGNVPRALLHRKMMFGHIALVEISTVSIYAVIAVVMAVQGYGVWSIVVAGIVHAWLMAATLLAIAGWRPRLYFSWTDIRTIFSFSANLTAFDVLNYLLFNADRLIVARYLGAGVLGIYDLANRLVGYVVRFFLPALLNVLFPALSRIADDDERLRSALRRATAGIALVFFPAIAGIAAIADIFVDVLLDPRWAPIAIVVPIIAVRYVLELVLRCVGVMYRVKGRTDLLLYWGIGSGSVFVVSCFIGLGWGLVGVAAAQTLAMCALTYPALRIPLSLIAMPIRNILSALVPYAVACILMIAAVRGFVVAGQALTLEGIVLLAGAITTGAVVYVLAVLALRARELQDLIYLVRGS